MANYNSGYTGQDLDSAIKLSRSGIAELFSTSKTYAVGDLAVYSGNLYKCNTAITTAGAWNSNKWSVTTVDEELDSVSGLPSGGTAGQVLTKVSAGDGDATWNDAPSVGQPLYIGTLSGASSTIDANTLEGHSASYFQPALVSGTNIKTINSQSLVGSGNVTISFTKSDLGLGNVDNTSDANKPISTATQTALNAKQATLVSGTNIKTINSTSLLGSGNISIGTGNVSSSEISTVKVLTQTEYDAISSKNSKTLYCIKS